MTDTSKEWHVPTRWCLHCGQILDGAATLPDGSKHAGIPGPVPGNATVCIACSHLMIFTEDMSLREPTPEEIEQLAGDSTLTETMKFLHHIRGLASGRR
jgi:hypothetical protein